MNNSFTDNKKFLSLLFFIILIIEVSSVFFMYTGSAKDLTTDEVKVDINNNADILSDKKELFAIMLEQPDSSYEKSRINVWPTNMVYNADKTVCKDISDNKLDNVISYNSEENKVTITSNRTAYCTIYFDIKDIGVTAIDNRDNTISVVLENGTNTASSYCINTLASDTSSCTWVDVSSTSFNVPFSSNGTYYIHIKDTEGLIYHSSSVAASYIPTSFNVSASDYQTINVSFDNSSSGGYKVKYASGNQASSYFASSGTDITSSLSFSVTSSGLYTIALLDSNNSVLLIKKVYIHNFASSTTRSRSTSVTVSGFTSIVGNPFVSTGTATATLSGTTLSLTAKDGTGQSSACIKTYTCPNGGTVSNKICTGTDYTQTSTTKKIFCECSSGSSLCSGGTTSTTLLSCKTGYSAVQPVSSSSGSPYGGTVTSCSGASTDDWYYYDKTSSWTCKWQGDYAATVTGNPDCVPTMYYKYTIGVVLE